MRMSEGVEWGLHCCVALGWIGEDQTVSTARLAARFGLPAAYLNKSLQALARAGILVSTAGPKGGFRLARPPAEITLLDVVDAIEGPEAPFRCTEIRQRGEAAASAAECRRPCAIAAAMRQAEAAWRRELSRQTIAMIMARAPRSAAERTMRWHASPDASHANAQRVAAARKHSRPGR
ncbi:Rrf2 family transcriptional regulator [Pigmentiphaga sp.]|jgi:Rrf2 family protein|uniref:RrF2 family transcriptional regulator n=1 Tax=Pigmentiphaga sp. TaxID=1977564 RepID=UPI0025DAEBF6|nr:Rrf2 family transcriptional regulator [Pigmentiphaga sp.]MBX6317695.1 Rrf2 family transcriptional regulator [Pigmentiphaga sp.]